METQRCTRLVSPTAGNQAPETYSKFDFLKAFCRNGISIFLDHLRQPDIKSYSNAIQVSTTIFNDGFYRSHGFISLGRTILMNDLTSLRVAGLIDFITQQGHRLAIGIFRIQRIDRTCVNINLTINLFKIERSTVAIYGLARLDVGNYDRGGIQLYAGVRHFRTW